MSPSYLTRNRQRPAVDRVGGGRVVTRSRAQELGFSKLGVPSQKQLKFAERNELHAPEKKLPEVEVAALPAAAEVRAVVPALPWSVRLARLAGVALIAPVCVLSLIAFLKHFLTAALTGSLFHSRDLHWFCLGAATWGLYHWQWRRGLMVTYVFAHEWTHALVARLFLAKVYRVVWSAQGGYVETNKSNIFISLAPYVVPLYTLVFLALYTGVGSFMDLDAVHEIQLGQATLPFNSQKLFFFCLGLTWCYHMAYTVQTLNTEQSDLQRNGECFSLFVILTLNLYLLAWLLLMCSPDLGWQGAWATLAETFTGGWELLQGLYQHVGDAVRATLAELQRADPLP